MRIDQIRGLLKNKSGVYRITSMHNKGFYIGSSCNIRSRIYQHRAALRRKTHRSKYLQNVYNKYGETNFDIEILEYCAIENLLTTEQYYLDTLKPIYNSNKLAASCLGRIMTQEHKDKISEALQGNTNGRFKTTGSPSKYKGVPRNPVVVEKIRLKLLGRNDYNKESIQKASQSRYRKVNQFTLNKEYLMTYNTIKEAAEITGANRATLNLCCQGKKKTSGGYLWQYANENRRDSRLIKK